LICEPNEKEENDKQDESEGKKYVTQTFKNKSILLCDDDIQRKVYQINNRSNSLKISKPVDNKPRDKSLK
jgi:hypothetical protein